MSSARLIGGAPSTELESFYNPGVGEERTYVDPAAPAAGKGAADAASTGSKPAKEPAKPTVPLYRLWRFATPLEVLLLAVAFVASAAHGVTQPIMTIVFGNLIDAFAPGSDIITVVSQACAYFLIIAAVAFVGGTMQVGLFSLIASRQVHRIRSNYLRAIIRQEMGWFDQIQSGELTTRIAGDVLVIQEGMGEKVGAAVQFLTMFVTGFIIGFVRSWKMALVILSVVPLLAIGGAFIGKIMAQFSTAGQTAYAKAGGVAEEVLSSMRTVTAFNGQQKEMDRYGVQVKEALRIAVRGGYARGGSLAFFFFVMFASYGLAFYYGATLIRDGEITAGQIVNVFFAVIMGAMGLGQAAPSFAAFASAQGAAYEIFQTIDREPAIDSLSQTGEKPAAVKGDISFEDVHFSYPKRPDVPVLNGLTISVKAGQTLALVGPSGCGKSTTVGLLQRFYDPASGAVKLDGADIRTLNVRWLREQIGVVSQEPVLFGRTIAENIMLGRDSSTRAEVEECARMANAYDFISKLPKGFDTMVGERGAALSGGQKQRIAIARALLRNPKILLLDEATSALDTKSERVVQDALDKARLGRTTIVIAHRLSTIQTADKIVVVEKGRVLEQGTHHELMELDGLYASLVRTQQVRGTIKGAGEASTMSLSPSVDALADPDSILPEEDVPVRPANPRTLTQQSKKSAGEKKEAEEAIDPRDLEVPTKGVVWRTYKVNAPEWFYIIIGSLGAMGNGSSFPILSIIFSRVLQDLLIKQGDDLIGSARFWSLMFVVLAVGVGISVYLQESMLGLAGERLSERLRNMLFRAFLRQNVGWYDEERHATGSLSARLANDSGRAQGVVGGNLSILMQTFSTLVTGTIIAFTGSWRVALIVLGMTPFAALGGAFELRLMMGFNQKARQAYEDSGKIASEAVENIRTVVSIGREQTFQDAYAEALSVPNQAARRQAVLNGLAFGFSQAMTFLIWAAAFYYGAHLVQWGINTFGEIMQAITAVIFSGMMIGQAVQLGSSFNKAVIACANIFHLVDQTPAIDSFSTEGKQLEKVEGHIVFEKVTFRYPTRTEVQVLRGLTFDLKPGKTMALVGASGCGKSTVIALMERFYDIESGNIFIDGVPIMDINVSSLRSQLGLVGQEPILFATTIYDNILYGKPNATREEVEEAAKQANIHNFIMTLPDKYDTYVGEKGAQLSGGQKQRIAIARALVRNPKILLLDEATSALDSESEKVVQEALDKARQGRTTIVIAHRLSTIQDADVICVVDQGQIIEQGTHQDLLQLQGRYYELVNRQAVPL